MENKDEQNNKTLEQLKAVWISGNLIKRICPDEVPMDSLWRIAESINEDAISAYKESQPEALALQEEKVREILKKAAGEYHANTTRGITTDFDKYLRSFKVTK